MHTTDDLLRKHSTNYDDLRRGQYNRDKGYCGAVFGRGRGGCGLPGEEQFYAQAYIAAGYQVVQVP